MKAKKTYSKLKKLLLVILLTGLLPVIYFGTVSVKAYFDTPAIVSKIYSSNKIKIKIEDLPINLQEALLKVEDPNFYYHNGIDLKTPGAGYTSITQAIVKVYFFDGFTPGFLRYKKVKQSLIALIFNSRVDKNTQLDIFINSVYLGNYKNKEIVGFVDGAKTYFDKEFSELSTDEYLSLVAMIIAPNDFNVAKHPEKNKDRVEKIKKLLKGEYKLISLTDVYY